MTVYSTSTEPDRVRYLNSIWMICIFAKCTALLLSFSISKGQYNSLAARIIYIYIYILLKLKLKLKLNIKIKIKLILKLNIKIVELD